MRRNLFILPVLLGVLAAFPAFPANAPLNHPLRPGVGAARVRDTTKGATAAQRTLPASAKNTVVRAYQPPKPGEGAPKG